MLSVKDINLLSGQNKSLKKQNKSLQKEIRELNQRYEQLRLQYDAVIAQHEAIMDKWNDQSKNRCIDCENETLQKYAETKIRCDKLEWWYKVLNKALDVKEELNQALREENELLKNKLRSEE